MTGGRMPTWRERENNKRRERRRRAFAAKIFAGLRLYGGYKLPKHCDNNEVLKALAAEAGWTVEPDGTTYRKGCKPVETIDMMGQSASMSPCSSYQPSPNTSYNPSPNTSSFPSPSSSSYIPPNIINSDPNSLIPWLKNLSSSSSSSSSTSLASSSLTSQFFHNHHHHHYMHSGSISAPVTPPISSPTCRTPRLDPNHFPARPFLPMSTPPSPGIEISRIMSGNNNINDQLLPQSGPTSPTSSLVSFNPFGFRVEDLRRRESRFGTPVQSGACSPVMVNSDIPMSDVFGCNNSEFAFGSGNGKGLLVKPWEGERIHEECGSDDLELTLGIKLENKVGN